MTGSSVAAVTHDIAPREGLEPSASMTNGQSAATRRALASASLSRRQGSVSMKSTLLAAAVAALLLSTGANALSPASSAEPALGSFGVDLGNRDTSVKPGDDFDRFANGHWQSTYQLKDYESDYGSFDALNDQSEADVRAIIEELARRTDLAPGSDEQKIRDYYASYMDQAARDAAGIKPLQPLLDSISAIDSTSALTAAFGRADVEGTNAPVGVGLGVDRKDPNRYLVGMGVGGLGLPDKDYYLNPDPRFVGIRKAYVAHIAKMLGFAGVNGADANARAEAVLALETALARPQWDRAERRDRDRTYNISSYADFKKTYPDFAWDTLFAAQELPAPAQINVVTPSAVAPVLKIVADTPLSTWRDYLRFHAVRNNSNLLSREIDEARFEFTGKVLQGQTAQKEQWKRAVATIADTDGLGEAVGRIYVARHFSPESKAAMDDLVANLRKALRANIEGLDWMGAATKAEAFHKLDTFRPKIGYTSKWRDYSTVAIVPNDLVANVMAMRRYYQHDTNRRVGTVPDREEWGMTPQTVNAYYNASFNEIVFPAAILQPPFFDVHADPAVNYGAIGAVIGHEMGHGFDDQGSKSDFAGIQRAWWTAEDRALFQQRVDKLGAQFDKYCPIENTCVNGKLTMGENIGDLGGLSMAYTAYHLSLGGKPAPVIDGLTGDQRFFLAWAQVWKAKYRDEALVNLIKSNPHSPAMYRVNGPLRNLDEWYTAFDVKPGDKLYVAPEDRVRIW
jgi:predicted metalloendopeptidase